MRSGLMCFLVFVVLCITCGPEGREVQSADKQKCSIMNIPLQKDFDTERFQGKWYLTTESVESSAPPLQSVDDVHCCDGLSLGVLSELTHISDGSKFYGGWCPKGKGHAVFPSANEPEKMTFFFDTRIGRKIGMKPGWILTTDYNNYAVFFSCWEVMDSGICDPLSTYVVVLQRKTTVLSAKHRTEVERALKRACVDPALLKPIEHYGYCPNDTEL